MEPEVRRRSPSQTAKRPAPTIYRLYLGFFETMDCATRKKKISPDKLVSKLVTKGTTCWILKNFPTDSKNTTFSYYERSTFLNIFGALSTYGHGGFLEDSQNNI